MERLWLDFVNSEFHNFRGLWTRDDLQDPAWRAHWLQRWCLPVTTPPDEETLAQLTELRALLFRAVETLNRHETIAEADLATLNTRLHQTSFIYQVAHVGQSYRLTSVPAKQDWNHVQSEIIVDFLTLLAEYDPQRLRICANQHCLYIFYDETRSHTRRFCSTDKCANLVKLRRFRAKKKAPRI